MLPQVFGETAMADMEVVFPDKKVGGWAPGGARAEGDVAAVLRLLLPCRRRGGVDSISAATGGDVDGLL
jgi:hypothetical protein